MTVLTDDPLIAGMTIARALPLHESSRRLRELYPECPRVYGVAVMSDLSRRRWWPLQEALTTDRLQKMFSISALETGSTAAAAQQLAATMAHVVLGRVIPLLVLEGRAWDTGVENLWVHVDSEGAIDWVGVADPTLRALPDDPFFRAREEQRIDRAREEQITFRAREERRGDPADVGAAASARDGMVRLPSEAALTTWIAHRSHRALAPLFSAVSDISGGVITPASMWHVVGAAVVGAATHIPLLARSSELTSMRRAQAVLDALVGFGMPVRGELRPRNGKLLLN